MYAFIFPKSGQITTANNKIYYTITWSLLVLMVSVKHVNNLTF